MEKLSKGFIYLIIFQGYLFQVSESSAFNLKV